MNRDYLIELLNQEDFEFDKKVIDRFEIYCDFLLEYNQKVNLTAIKDPDEVIVKHFIDSVMVLKHSEISVNSKIADVGTGPGFPAIPMLIMRNDLDFSLIEATKKKLVFIEQLLEKLNFSANLLHLRGEEAGKMPQYREKFDFVTARAVANLRELSEYCLPLVKIGGKMISMKGNLSEEELEMSNKAIKLLGGKIENKVQYSLPNSDNRTIITIEKIKNTPNTYPRTSALISKKPII